MAWPIRQRRVRKADAPARSLGQFGTFGKTKRLRQMILRSPPRNNSGSFDEAITAVLAASTWADVKPMDLVRADYFAE